MPCFHIMGTDVLTPWYEGSRRRRNVASAQGFRRNPHEVPRSNGRQGGRTLAPSLSVSTKGVHGVWITMWMSDQCHAVPQHLTHCTIGRQHNPCNFIEVPFFGRNSHAQMCRFRTTRKILQSRAYRTVQNIKAELGWQDIADGRSFHSPDITPLFRHRNQCLNPCLYRF